MIPIWEEPSYSNSIWCMNILEGLVSVLKQKRMPFCYISSVDDVDKSCAYIFVIGSDNEWVQAALRACNYVGLYPILLCNHAFATFDAEYSIVCSDIASSMRYLIDTLRASGKRNIALYGVNRKSLSDESRRAGYLAVVGPEGRQHVYFNHGSLDGCFWEFIDRVSGYDAVICVNDFSAVSLVRLLHGRYPALLQRLMVTSCAETWLSSFFSDQIHSIQMNFADYGKAAVMIMESLNKSDYVSHIRMSIKWDIRIPHEKTSTQENRAELRVQMPEHLDVYYEDTELRNMMSLEKLLCKGNEVDRTIITMLLRDKSYEEIGEACYLTESSIKYHVKAMCNLCDIEGRRELVALIKSVLD